ncbi:MAG: PAS domain S-box protein [Sulfurospirillaceae bacterium]|nr:PAS domain S-box protein [Sulfurospirillaceae bacterium]
MKETSSEKLLQKLALLEAENKALKHVVNKANVYINSTDTSYVIVDSSQDNVDVNETFFSLFGYTKEEAVTLHFSKLFTTPQLYHSWWKTHHNFHHNDSVGNFEYRFLTKDRRIFWAEVFGKRFEENGEEFSVWSIRDISLRVHARNTIKNLNQKLQKQFEEIQDILEIIPMPIYIKDKKFRYIGCNGAFCNFFGLTKSMILGKKVYDIFPEALASINQQKDEDMPFVPYQTYKVNLKVLFQKENVTFELHKKRILRDNEFEGIVGVLIDVTEKEKQEKYLQKRIEEEVDKNLKIISAHQEEMIRNTKFTSIGKMAAGITHEINTPLTYVKGNFEMLVEDIGTLPSSDLRTTMLNDAQVIQDGLDRIANIIETMREVSQKSSEQTEKINIYETLISALILSYNRSKQVVKISLNGVIFDPSVSKNALTFWCNVQKQRIEQVWIIILNNALDELVKIESFEKRSLLIETTIKRKQLIVRISDNAGGIAHDILPRIFEPFESTKMSSGIGIGLNIAHSIIEQNDGTIIAYNSGDGAVFEVSLPLLAQS